MGERAEEVKDGLKAAGRRAFRYAAALSFPRLVGSAGEAEAREKTVQFMSALGLTVERQKFMASDYAINRLARFALLPPGVLLCLAGLAYAAGWAWLATVLALAALGLIFWAGRLNNRGFIKLAHKGRKFTTQNIIGRLPVENPQTTVVFMAHYDSKSQTFPVLLRIAVLLLGTLGTIFLALVFIASGLVSAAGISIPWASFWPWVSAATLVLDALPAFNKLHNRSDGALDNAAGVGVMLELASLFNKERPAEVELIFVATAAEELGLCGAIAFIQEWKGRLDPQRTYFINYDSPGADSGVMALAAFGIPRQMLDVRLNRWLKEIARERAIPLRMIYLPVGAAVDLVPVLAEGYRGVNISSLVSRVHTPRDTIDKVSEQVLEDAVVLGYELVQRLAREQRGK